VPVGSSCVSCGAEVAESARFCQTCGAPQWRTCPACGNDERASAAFCSACGAALRDDVPRAAIVGDHEERRVVSILFADLAGSTALGERIDPEDVRAVQHDLFRLVNDEVERHGGMTEKFVGDAILAVFGAPRAYEDHAERAVRTALAVRDAFPTFAAAIADRFGTDVGLRVGVNTGEVIAGREAAARGELMVSGDAVNVAARLQQLAGPGSVLVGERTMRATRRAIEFGARRELSLRGKEDAVAAWEAVCAGPHDMRRGRGHAAPLVGRDEELALLRLTAARVERERVPQLVTIFGHAGVGKSRLLEEFGDAVGEGRVVTGRCVPYGHGITYLPLVEVASQLAGIRDDDRAEIALAKLRRSVEAAVSPRQVENVTAALAWTVGLALPGGSAGIAEGGDVRRTLHEGWATYLAALGREELLVLVIDDIHWASDPLLDLLDDLAALLEGTAVLILCPSRPELLDSRPGWGGGRLASSSLTLAPLDSPHAEVLLRALLQTDDVPEHVARAILEPADGNPFFVEEILSMLVEQGALERTNGEWTATSRLASARVPDSIHGVIAARIDLLQASERDALRRCSVMGRTFWPSAVGVDDEVVAVLGRRALVAEHPDSSFSGRREFSFKHALTHEVAYASLPRKERRELHRRVAEWIAGVVPDRQAEMAELMAYHFEEALRHGDHDSELEGRAFDALLAAADAAVRRGAYETASALLGRALEVAPSGRARARALLLAGRADVAERRYDQAVSRLEEVLDAADRDGDAALRADALGWKARACWLRGSWREALESSEEAVVTLEGVPESPELARALARLSQIQMLRALPVAEETASRAIAVARRTGEPAAEANARTNLYTVRSWLDVPPRREDLTEVVELAQSAGAHDEAARALINYLWSAWLYEPLDAVEATVREIADGLGRGLATESYNLYLQLSRGVLVYVPTGRWKEADDLVGAWEPSASASNRLVWLWLVTGLALRRGGLELADRLLPEFEEMALASEEPQRILPFVSVAMPRALIAADTRRVRELGDVVLELTVPAVGTTSAVTILRVLAEAGELDRVERLTRALESPRPGLRATAAKLGAGLLARSDGKASAAADLLLEVENELVALDRRYDAACVALEVGRALEGVRDEDGASAARRRAAGVLEALGCVNPY
jgi:class 3 adenylate cyclase/tetratricopeptide (TPR) repeat protein